MLWVCLSGRLCGSNPLRASSSLSVLARILAAVDLELRSTVEYDSHGKVLDAEHARLTDDARLTGGNEQRRRAKMRQGSPL